MTLSERGPRRGNGERRRKVRFRSCWTTHRTVEKKRKKLDLFAFWCLRKCVQRVAPLRTIPLHIELVVTSFRRVFASKRYFLSRVICVPTGRTSWGKKQHATRSTDKGFLWLWENVRVQDSKTGRAKSQEAEKNISELYPRPGHDKSLLGNMVFAFRAYERV